MDPTLLALIRCPFCCGTFKAAGTDEAAGDFAYGTLSCNCGRYPVVAGIPILLRGAISANGDSADSVIAMIESGRTQDALVAMLMPRHPSSAEFAPRLIKALPTFRGMSRLKGLFGHSALRSWKKEGQSLLTTSTDQITITEFLNFYFGHMGVYGSNNYNYFSFRLGQPRFLAALSLASIVQQPKKAILDLACGFGNVTRFILKQSGAAPVVGVDQDFFSLYVAKNWLARGAHYVCAAADISVPLADDSCSLAFCSDAFQLFMHQATCIRELKRLAGREGVIALASVRNALVKKHLYSGSVLPAQPPEGYRTLVADMPHRLVSDASILERYLAHQGPPLANQPEAAELAGVQWMSLVASYRSDVFRDYPRFEEWPHIRAEVLGLNPLYKAEGKDAAGNLRLHREFPSSWYEQENRSSHSSYQPESVFISSEGVADLSQQKRTLAIDNLIEQGIVLGIPEPYLRTSALRGRSGRTATAEPSSLFATGATVDKVRAHRN